MALDLAADNIRVNGIGPGVIETAMTKSFLENEQWKQFFLMKIPLKRVGQPVEIAKMALFLASDAASYMTGTTVFIDGGWLTG
jgi:NAD(P)-dependent dehydrogenase (short-subunit alcohol dehydrogenase family)